jgi:hypothetical protein
LNIYLLTTYRQEGIYVHMLSRVYKRILLVMILITGFALSNMLFLAEIDCNAHLGASECSATGTISNTIVSSENDIEISLTHTPSIVYNGQPATILANVVGEYSTVLLNVSILIITDTNGTSLNIPEPLPSFPYIQEENYQTELIPIGANWYMTVIPGLPAMTLTWTLLLQPTYAIWVNSSVEYSLIVDGIVREPRAYEVTEIGGLDLPPIVFACVDDALDDSNLFLETYGLGPKGWAVSHDATQKVVVTAIDDKGLQQNDITFEYSVSNSGWTSGTLTQYVIMDIFSSAINNVNVVVTTINDLIDWINLFLGLSLSHLDTIEVSMQVLEGEIPTQDVGNWVLFRANVTDTDDQTTVSPQGFYYIKNGMSDKKVLIIDPHVRLWLLQENMENFVNQVRRYIDYDFPDILRGNSTLIAKLGDILEKSKPESFHHWELLGKHYDIYIADPNERLAGLLTNASEGGFEPDAIVLSDLWLGFSAPNYGQSFTWDLNDIQVDEKNTLFECLRDYTKTHHAGIIATHGTLSDWTIWLSEGNKYKIGSRGHIGNSPLDFDSSDEKTIAAMLGMPQLSLWEFIRDKIAEQLLLLGTEVPPLYLAGLLTGSLPLQIPNVPFNDTLVLRQEVTDSMLIQNLPSSFAIDCPSLYNEFGVRSYTEVGWQLALPRLFAYSAWDAANSTRDILTNYVTKIATLLGNATNNVISEDNVTRILDALKWGMNNMYAAISHSNISALKFNMSINIPGWSAAIPLDIELDFRELLRLLPAKIVASSSNALAGIIAYDKYWDENGYRSVYFSLEVESSSSFDLAENLFVNAVEWTTDWEQLTTTELLGDFVRVTTETADSFSSLLDAIPGDVTYENETILTEEGYTELDFYLNEGGVCNLVIAHPTCETVTIVILDGNATISTIIDGDHNLTKVLVTANNDGTIKIGIQADPDSSLNPAYFVLKIDVDAPIWDQLPEDQVAEYGQSFWYDLNASDPSNIDNWWLNDTTHFAIDLNGIITNVTPLAIGIYSLQVFVNDSYGNVQTAFFTVIVEDTTSPIWVIAPTNQILEYGEPLDIQLEAFDLSGIDNWSINDTIHFTISANGRINSIITLDPSIYALTVSVFDLYDNTLSGTFTVTVREEPTISTETSTTITTTPIQPSEGLDTGLLLLAAASIGVIVVLIVIVGMKHK